jgi:hypothetical protein
MDKQEALEKMVKEAKQMIADGTARLMALGAQRGDMHKIVDAFCDKIEEWNKEKQNG